jgi:hypothetical protein
LKDFFKWEWVEAFVTQYWMEMIIWESWEDLEVCSDSHLDTQLISHESSKEKGSESTRPMPREMLENKP